MTGRRRSLTVLALVAAVVFAAAPGGAVVCVEPPPSCPLMQSQPGADCTQSASAQGAIPALSGAAMDCCLEAPQPEGELPAASGPVTSDSLATPGSASRPLTAALAAPARRTAAPVAAELHPLDLLALHSVLLL